MWSKAITQVLALATVVLTLSWLYQLARTLSLQIWKADILGEGIAILSPMIWRPFGTITTILRIHNCLTSILAWIQHEISTMTLQLATTTMLILSAPLLMEFWVLSQAQSPVSLILTMEWLLALTAFSSGKISRWLLIQPVSDCSIYFICWDTPLEYQHLESCSQCAVPHAQVSATTNTQFEKDKSFHPSTQLHPSKLEKRIRLPKWLDELNPNNFKI